MHCEYSGLILSELEAINKDNFDVFPDTKGLINFQKRRHFARVIQQVQRYQSSCYNFRPIEVYKQAPNLAQNVCGTALHTASAVTGNAGIS